MALSPPPSPTARLSQPSAQMQTVIQEFALVLQDNAEHFASTASNLLFEMEGDELARIKSRIVDACQQGKIIPASRNNTSARRDLELLQDLYSPASTQTSLVVRRCPSRSAKVRLRKNFQRNGLCIEASALQAIKQLAPSTIECLSTAMTNTYVDAFPDDRELNDTLIFLIVGVWEPDIRRVILSELLSPDYPYEVLTRPSFTYQRLDLYRITAEFDPGHHPRIYEHVLGHRDASCQLNLEECKLLYITILEDCDEEATLAVLQHLGIRFSDPIGEVIQEMREKMLIPFNCNDLEKARLYVEIMYTAEFSAALSDLEAHFLEARRGDPENQHWRRIVATWKLSENGEN
ncbi:hypothetical protein P154DRAFT_529594 [Amniculicola lignicola CBS 123094]|uniref:Uncharacterized protein n=1 Tax=Amniculicola lignicola CBS 123094 TaxID=1392246 RepID=A0A6A5WZD7_9PLEO|nr:hypothetical protein P154DRAFT_529594 [Amniculicola lignicola CBS 123094]